MKIDSLKERKELISVALLCVSGILAISILVKIAVFFTASARAENIVKTAFEQNANDADDIDKYFTKYKILAEALKKNNLFVPAPPKQHPVQEITGIFGNEVIIRDRLYKAGDKVADATIVSIEPTQVIIEWEGKQKTFSPMNSKGSLQPGNSGRSSSSARASASKSGGGAAQMVTVGSGFRVNEGKFKNKSKAKIQAKRAKQDAKNLKNIQERWSTLSEKEKQKLTKIKERWPSMSEGERDKIRTGLRERFGGGK